MACFSSGWAASCSRRWHAQATARFANYMPTAQRRGGARFQWEWDTSTEGRRRSQSRILAADIGWCGCMTTSTGWTDIAPSTRPESRGAGGRPQIDTTLGRVTIDLHELAGLELEFVQGGRVLFELRDTARPDQRRSHDWVAQGPRDRHLRKRLAPSRRDLVEGPDLGQVLLDQHLR